MRNLLLVLCLAALSVGCAHQSLAPQSAGSTAPTLTSDPSHPGQTTGWVDTKLYFGLGPVEHPDQGISETRWREFLDREVTPRFPAGLSVLDVYGQWLTKGKTIPERLRSKLMIIDYPDTRENRDKVDAIRSAWKAITGDKSVLRVTQPADVSF